MSTEEQPAIENTELETEASDSAAVQPEQGKKEKSSDVPGKFTGQMAVLKQPTDVPLDQAVQQDSRSQLRLRILLIVLVVCLLVWVFKQIH